MARRQVVEVECSRCERKETQEVELIVPEGATASETADQFRAVLYMGGSSVVTVRFEDLCTPCQRTIKGLLEQAGKKIEGVSPDRVTKPKATKKGEPAGQVHNGPAPHVSAHASAGADPKKPPAARSS